MNAPMTDDLVERVGERIADEVEKVAGGRQSNCEAAARDIVAMITEAADALSSLRKERLPKISFDGPHLPDEHRVWLARQLLDSKLSDTEAYGIVAHSPALSSREGGEGWRPIETAPKDQSWVILLTADPRRYPPAVVARWMPYLGNAAQGYWHPDAGDPTHWRPLPAPPALSREGGEGVQHEPEVNHAKPLSTEAGGH